MRFAFAFLVAVSLACAALASPPVITADRELPPAEGDHFVVPDDVVDLWKDWGDAQVLQVGNICHQVEQLVQLGMIEANPPFHHHIPVLGLWVMEKDGKRHHRIITIEKTPHLQIRTVEKTELAEKKNHAFGLNANWCLPLTRVPGKPVLLRDVLCLVGKVHGIERLSEYSFIKNNCQHWSTSLLYMVERVAGAPIPGLRQKIKTENFHLVPEANRKRSKGLGALNKLTPGLNNKHLLDIGNYAISAVMQLKGKLAGLKEQMKLPQCENLPVPAEQGEQQQQEQQQQQQQQQQAPQIGAHRK